MRTLIVSDLHLGNRGGHDTARLPGPRARLLEAVDGVDRLVLLGDTVELMGRRPRRSMAIAEPVLRELGRRLGPDREVILVPGNHDAPLVRAWALHRGRELGLSDAVEGTANRALAQMLSWLAPARSSVRYPGVWLEDRVWATHGHYLDRHLMPESAFGLPRGRLGADRPVAHAHPIDYEHARRRSIARSQGRARQSLAERFAARPGGTALEEALGLLSRMTMPRVPVAMQSAGLTPLTVKLIDAQMRYGSLAAMAHVTRRLGVDADWVVFGHVHRAGPLDGDRWPRGNGPHLLNTGSWLYEPLLLDQAVPPHPYWPGGAVVLESGSPPRTVGLLDDLEPAQLRPT